jgi:hypothetical protein
LLEPGFATALRDPAFALVLLGFDFTEALRAFGFAAAFLDFAIARLLLNVSVVLVVLPVRMVSSVRLGDDIALKMEHVSVIKPRTQLPGCKAPAVSVMTTIEREAFIPVRISSQWLVGRGQCPNLNSLRLLCVLCLSAVMYLNLLFHRGDAEGAEIAQKKI